MLKDICVYLKFSKTSNKNISKVSSDVYEIFEKCKTQLNIKTNINFVVQEQIKTPSLYGILSPRILVTNDVVSLSKDELECIFIHELNHYKSKHQYIYMILLLLKRIYWFNPIIYFADKIIKQDLEYMIDEQVLDIFKNEKTYFKTIVKVLAMSSGLVCSIPNICGGKVEVERRIKQMKHKKVNTLFSRIVVCAIIVTLSMITISLASEKTYTNDDLFSGELILENDETQGKTEVVKPLANAIVTAAFGEHVNPITGQKIVHTGIDVTSNETDEIVSIADGKVIFVGYDVQRGNNIKIKHQDGSVSAYSHGKEILVKEGDEVYAGEKIMIMGATGMATGEHLHFELINSAGEYVDVNQIF